MLKMIAVIGLVGAMGLAFTSCTDPINAWQDPIVEYPQVHVDAYSMQQRIRVQKPIATRFGAGQLQVDVPIRNLTDDDLTIDYVYYFMDSKGIEIGDPQTAFLRVQRKGIGQIEIKSMSAQAADFRVEIKDAH